MNEEKKDGNRVIVVIDGNRFSDLEGFYDEVQRVLTKDLDWKIGHNLDAFADILRGGFGVFEDGDQVHLIWRNFSKSKEDFGYPSTITFYRENLKICHYMSRDNIRRKLESAKQGKGPALLDIIVSIIQEEQFSSYIEFSVEH